MISLDELKTQSGFTESQKKFIESKFNEVISILNVSKDFQYIFDYLTCYSDRTQFNALSIEIPVSFYDEEMNKRSAGVVVISDFSSLDDKKESPKQSDSNIFGLNVAKKGVKKKSVSHKYLIKIKKELVNHTESALWASEDYRHIKSISFYYSADFDYIHHQFIIWYKASETKFNNPLDPTCNSNIPAYEMYVTFNRDNTVEKIRMVFNSHFDNRMYVVNWPHTFFDIDLLLIKLLSVNKKTLFREVFPELNDDNMFESSLTCDEIKDKLQLVHMLSI